MKLKNGRRAAALILSVVLTICGIEFPAADVRAAAGVPDGTITEADSTKTLFYGNRVSLDGEDFEPVEITNTNEISYFSGGNENFEMTMVFRLNEVLTPNSQCYPLFTLQDGTNTENFISIILQPFNNGSNTNQGRIHVMNNTTGLLSFSSNGLCIKDTNYHKLSMAITGNRFEVILDGASILSWGNAAATNARSFFTASRDSERMFFGIPAEGVTNGSIQSYLSNLNGTIRYVEFSNAAYTNANLIALNNQVSETLKTSFESYVSGHEDKQWESYTTESWIPFETALQAARAVKDAAVIRETGIYSTYGDLKAAAAGLDAYVEGSNHAPTAKEFSGTLVKGRTLSVSAADLAEDEDGDILEISIPESSTNEKLNLAVGDDGKLQISCKDDSVSDGVSEDVTVTVSDKRKESVNVTFPVSIADDFKIELDLRGYDFNPKAAPNSVENIYKADRAYTTKIRQIKDSLEVSVTFRFDASKSYNAAGAKYVYLMEIGDSRNNYSDQTDNSGAATGIANSSLSIFCTTDGGKIFCSTGAYAGSTDWQPQTGVSLEDGRVHTLTLSIAPDAMNVYLDGAALQSVSSDSNDKKTKKFVTAFFGGTTTDSSLKDWRSDIDMVTIGDCYEYSSGRHRNYGRFGGEIKSVVIADGAYSQADLQAHHNLYGTDIAKEDLRAMVEPLENKLSVDRFNSLKETDIYKKAAGILEGSTVTYAADIYNTMTDLQSALNDLDNEGLTDIGGSISNMFGDSADNTWIFGGGVETQGRFSEIAGLRNYIGHFEEYVRWNKRTGGGASQNAGMQRYTINLGKTEEDAAAFAGSLDTYKAALDPKAAAYLIGPEDYMKGDTGLDAFRTSLTAIIEKSLALREGTGFAVIQLPHAVDDADKAALVEKYAQAAKDTLRAYIAAHADQKDRIVMVDHTALTNTETFKAGCLTENGLLNADGHFEVAKEFAEKTFGSSAGFQAITRWEEEEAPDRYETKRPAVTAEAGGSLKVAVPADVAADKNSWNYKIEIEEMEICGSATEADGRTFTIDELPEGEKYTLTLTSSDNAVQLAKVYGTLTAGNEGGAAELTALQQKLKAKLDTADGPLTWLFMGDSITHGALWMNGYDGIAQIFEKYLKEDIGRSDDIVINTAVSSSTAKSTVANLQQRLRKYTPDIVSVMLGTNDATDGIGGNVNNLMSKTYIENMETIVAEIRKRNADAFIIFRTPTPTKDATRKKGLEDKLLKAMKKIAEEDGNILFIDQYTDWNQELDAFPYLYGTRYYYGDQNLHPGAAGQLRMAQQFIRECGLNTDTPIANLSYRFDYTESTQDSVPEFTTGRTRIALEKEDIEKLQTDSGKTFGSVEVTLTDTANNRTYTKRDYTSGDRFILRYLPNSGEGGRNYQVSVTGSVAGSAEKVKFGAAQAVLSTENEVLPYYVFLDRTYIRDASEGAVAAKFYTGIAAPEGTYHYEFASIDGQNNDNDLFEIEGDVLKTKDVLNKHNSYTVCVQAVKDGEPENKSLKGTFTLRTMPTLNEIREDAKQASESKDDLTGLDLDLAGVSFEGEDYVDLGGADSAQYEDGKYLAVLNKLRESTTGGTIIYRFRTTQANALIFGSGSNPTVVSNDNTIMAFGLSGGELRGIFRAPASSLRGNFDTGGMLNDGNWHTVAISFDTTKTDYQNQVLMSVDGSENVFRSDWWTADFKTWFNQNQDREITRFAIGGGPCTTTDSLGTRMEKFTGDISFVTINDEVYTEDELRLLTYTDWIEGEQALKINGNIVTLPEDAAYTASSIIWDEDNAEAEFTLTANEGALFDDETFISISNAETLGVVDQIHTERSADSRSLNVRFNINGWRSDSVFEKTEITVKNGVSSDEDAVFDTDVIEKLGTMRRGSVTVRYKLDESALEEGRLALFSVSNGNLNGYSAFYITPSTGAVGYSIRNQEGNASTTINSDEAAREDLKNTNWHTVTYLFNASGTEIYLDGNRILANTDVGFLRNTANISHAQIGSVYRSADQANAFAFNGEINYLQVTYDVLDEDEIKVLHAATTAEALELPEGAVKTEEMNLYSENYADSPYYEMPSLLTTSEGTLIAAVDKRQTTEADRGNIDTVIRRSTDNGKTWGEPQTIFNQPDGGVMYSFTTLPTMVEGTNGRIHMLVNLFPESQGRLATGLIEKGSGFKAVDGNLYPVLRNYGNTALNAENTWTQEYTIRENGVVYEETEAGSTATEYRVPNYLAAEGAGDLYAGDQYCGNIYVYTGQNAGDLKVPRVMSVVTCYSDDNGETWKGYQNITGMIKEDWMKFMRVGPGAGIRLQNQTDTALNGRIVVPICYTNGDGINSYAAALIYSDDNGVTWKRTDSPVSNVVNNIEAGTFREHSLRESQIVEMNDGSIQMFSTNYSGRIKRTKGTFAGDTMTWSDIQQTTIVDMTLPVSVIHAPGNVDGKEAILLSAPLGPESNNGYIHIGLYQENGTFEWKYLRKVKADDFSYSSLSILKNEAGVEPGKESIGILFKGSDQDITFTSMTEQWFTAPRYAEFTKPVIENIEMERSGSELTFTVTLDSAMMKKGSPVLKLKLDEKTDVQAEYRSGNGSKRYVFLYDIGDQELESVTAINLAMPGDTGFVEGVTGLVPDDVSFKFELGRESVIAEMNKKLQELKELFESDGSEYDEELWKEFQDAYKAVQNAVNGDTSTSAGELSRILKALTDAKLKLDEADPNPPYDKELEEAKAALKKVLTDYQDTFDKMKAEYSETSWKVFEDAYKAAQEALEEGADKDTLKKLRDELETAYKALDPVRHTTKLAAPNIASLKAVAEKKAMGVKIQVEKVANADVYTVYRTVGSSVKEIGRTNAAGIVYDQTPISKKTASYYAVAESASGQYQKSDNGAAKTIKVAASVKKVTAKRIGKKTQVRLSWKKVKSAQKYVVYRSMNKDSGYVRLKTLKKSAKSYVDKKVKKGKTYYYRIVIKTKKGYTGVTTSKKIKIKK